MQVSEQTCANSLRFLAIDMIERARSGHPGMPMGMADIAQTLWQKVLVHNPKDPAWINRDRFILSNGHGSALLYALLHMSGYSVSIEDLKQFRQLGSKTPGHPEYDALMGVECTTGPLGQGIGMSVGMALTESILSMTYNRPDFNLIDYYTYVFVGDGCLMEGLSHEACSLAGTLQLSKLIVFWDDNGISIDGETTGWFTENVAERFSAYGWHVIANIDGHDAKSILEAIIQAKEDNRPSLLCCQTQIGFGAPNIVGTAKSHGAPLGEAEIKLTREQLGWSHMPFEVPESIYQAWDASKIGQKKQSDWQSLFAKYQRTFPKLANELVRRTQAGLPNNWQTACEAWIVESCLPGKALATRQSSQQCLTKLSSILPELFGGSADLTGSNGTKWQGAEVLQPGRLGNYLQYGVREFAMFSIMNGMAVSGGVLPFGGTFLTFSDYGKNAMRIAAMMQQRVVFVLTHDSIGLGEDGPTHQPIEHIWSCRMIPNMQVWRPCDGLETMVAWQQAVMSSGPSCMLLTRQVVPQYGRSIDTASSAARGGYVLLPSSEQHISAVIIATGSEVQLAMQAAEYFAQQKIGVSVVSMPCLERFRQQDIRYQEQVLPASVSARVAVEAGVTGPWREFVGRDGEVVGIDSFGASAPGAELYEHFALTTQAVISAVEKVMEKCVSGIS